MQDTEHVVEVEVIPSIRMGMGECIKLTFIIFLVMEAAVLVVNLCGLPLFGCAFACFCAAAMIYVIGWIAYSDDKPTPEEQIAFGPDYKIYLCFLTSTVIATFVTLFIAFFSLK